MEVAELEALDEDEVVSTTSVDDNDDDVADNSRGDDGTEDENEFILMLAETL